ncbi:ABC transporter substrate-binding protein [Sphingobium boeckii]|nr:ABC transporter substrate-binding protein [Sphingobium boeckii]
MKASGVLIAMLAAALPISIGSAARFPGIPAPTAKPLRVMSMNQCTDQLVLALLPPERIASVTWLARDAEGSLMAAEAMRVGVNHGLAEDVLRQKPDLVVAGDFSTPATRGLLKRMGYPIIEVPHASSFEDIRKITRQVAQAVGEKARGEMLLARMDRQLAALADHPRPLLRVAAWDGAGFNASKGSLYNAVLEAARAVNVANTPPASGYGAPDAEVLLAAAPALLVQGQRVFRRPGLRDNLSRHWLVRRYWDGDRTLTIRQAYYVCGTPFVADAALQLQKELRQAAAAVRTPLPFTKGVLQ